MGNAFEVTRENFNSTIETNSVVLLDFWAAWCGPCRMFAPIFEKAASKHAGVAFGKIDTEAQPELAAAFEIRSIPTLMAFRDGILVFAQPGMLPEQALDELIGKIQALDMNQVRTELKAQQAASAQK